MASSCVPSDLAANEVLLLGDSFFATAHQVTAYLEELARSEGVLQGGERYRDNSSLMNNTLALLGNGITDQYERGKMEDRVRVVIMNGGGGDVVQGQCQIPLSSCPALLDAAAAAEQLFAEMAQDGVSDVIYAFYPDPVDDVPSLDKMNALRPLIQTVCQNSVLACHWLDLRPTFAGHYAEYVLADGRNPSGAGSEATAKAIWATMRRDCVAQ